MMTEPRSVIYYIHHLCQETAAWAILGLIQGLLNESIEILVHPLFRPLSCKVEFEGVEWTKLHLLDDLFGANHVVIDKLLFPSVICILDKHIGRVSHDEFRRDIHGKSQEKGLEINFRAIGRDMLEERLEVSFESV